jgi:hypothetical protein
MSVANAKVLNRPRRSGGALLALVLIGILAVITGVPVRSSPAQDATATFLGFTNVTGKGRCAMFAITNASGPCLGLLVDSFEESASGV